MNLIQVSKYFVVIILSLMPLCKAHNVQQTLGNMPSVRGYSKGSGAIQNFDDDERQTFHQMSKKLDETKSEMKKNEGFHEDSREQARCHYKRNEGNDYRH